ncbi:MAG: hypothetical protein IE928_08650 [Gammaproteobacteria bacterium]|nr:hypothetical protein [Gammaproteobacteria bacterium]
MNLSDTFKSVIGAVAPVLGAALGGPLGGAAASQIAQSLLGKTDATSAELEQAVKNATPEQLASLKKLDHDFQIRMEELGLDLERINQQGIADARAREIAVNDKVPAVLAIAVTIGFFGVLGWMVYDGTKGHSDALLVMLGALGGAWGAVMNYYFGSSSGSAKKNELLARGKA